MDERLPRNAVQVKHRSPARAPKRRQKKTVGERSLLRMEDARLLLRGYIMVESRLSDRFLERWLDRLRPKYHCPFRTRSAVHMTDRQQRFVMVGAAVGLVVLIHLAPLWFSER